MSIKSVSQWFMFFFLMLGLGIPIVEGASKGRRLIAVFDFDYSTVADQWGETPLNIGAGLADMLVTELVKEGTYTVVERKKLQQVIAEQKMNQSDQFDPKAATEIGKLLGVDAIVIGSVTQFGIEKSTTGTLDAAGQTYGGLEGIKTHVQTAVVGIDVRLIDTKTAVVLAAATGKGVDRRISVTSDSRRDQYLEPGSHRSFSDISQQLVGGAASQAVSDLTFKLADQADKLQVRQIRGKVADVEDSIVVVNIGRADGLTSGDLLAVERVYKTVKDPVNPTKVLRKLGKRVATLQVKEMDEKSAIAVVVRIEEGEVINVGFEVFTVDESPLNDR